MENVIQKLSEYKLVPVVTIDDKKKAVELSSTLKECGLPLIEITFRTQAAEESILQIRKNHPDMIIGAGTILNIEQASAAQKAGADFMVSPGFNPDIVDWCMEHDILFIPGVDSPTLIERALAKGINLVKFFPARQSGGIDYLKAIAGPYNDVKLMPTGGVNPDNLLGYLDFKKVVACGSSWIVPSSSISEGDFEKIARRTRMALKLIHDNKPEGNNE